MSTPRSADRRRVFVAGMGHETNVFSPIPTDLPAFYDMFGDMRGTGLPSDAHRALPAYGAMVRAAEAAGCEVVVADFAYAHPSGRGAASVYAEVRDRILDDLARHGPFDAILYFLHGAQMAEGEDDCEGDLLCRTRGIVGPDATVAVELDLHANVSTAMIEAADIVLACREYPHTDFDARAVQLVDLAVAAVERRIRPTTRFARVPMMGLFHTTDPGLAALVGQTVALEGTDGIHAVSLIHGFAQANTPLVGAGVLIVAERDTATDTLAAKLAHDFFALRGESASQRRSLNKVVAAITAVTVVPAIGPLVVADYADNAGGGAGSDATFLLEALIEAKVDKVALGLMWDPAAVDLAHDAGVGATIALRLGGKSGAFAGMPLAVTATVTALRDDLVQAGLGLSLALGRSTALDLGGVVVIVNSVRQQVFSPTCFTDHGIDLATLRAVVVKSGQHFHATFAPLAREILYCETPGVMMGAFPPDRFDRVKRPIWPIDDITWPATPVRTELPDAL